jgi:uncharacterized protein (TIGR01777 family)
MKLLISGASGMVGSTLASAWRSQGHHVLTLVRDASKRRPNTVLWEPPHTGPDLNALEELDAVIHLAGETIAEGRWTPRRKAAILASRVDTTQLLAKTFSQLKVPPKTWICASAIGYYGDRGATVVTEEDAPGKGFLPEVCQAWEAAADPAHALGLRVVHVRIGMVLSLQGGALPSMKRPFEWGVGGPIGAGTQYMSWITLEDLCGIIRYAVREKTLQGPVNAVTSQAVTNAEFSKALAAVLHRPHFFHWPAAVARMALGEMADALLLASVRVKPAVLEARKYPFLFPELRGALEHLLR